MEITVKAACGLERDGLIIARWEDESLAFAEQTPARRYYRVTRNGKQNLVRLVENPLLEKVLCRKGKASFMCPIM